ncbi:MAG: DUF1003 domain-containing protein [Clostridia bacterium]|nr:DUF1003 domain-containing protein [Clostridia bacterium]
MNTQKNRAEIIKELLHITDKELTDEELLKEILSTDISENSEKGGKEEKITFGQKAADAVARFAGSWAFIFSFIAVMVIWMVMNVLLAAKAFDAYPFILLNLVLSCIAAVQAPLIMMSQNRQEVKDRKRAENDYRVNLKSEFVIDALYKKLESVSEMQKKIFKKLEALSGGETTNAADESLSYKEKTEINENKDKSNRP